VVKPPKHSSLKLVLPSSKQAKSMTTFMTTFMATFMTTFMATFMNRLRRKLSWEALKYRARGEWGMGEG
jgi:hypothetical protein